MYLYSINFFYDVRNLFVVVRNGVAVEVQRVAYFAVPQTFGDFGDGYAFCEKLRRHRVAQNVEVLVLDACQLQDALPYTFHITRAVRRAVARMEGIAVERTHLVSAHSGLQDAFDIGWDSYVRLLLS